MSSTRSPKGRISAPLTCGALTIAALIAISAEGRADHQVVEKDVIITSGDDPETWVGESAIATGSGTRMVWGNLDIASPGTGDIEDGDSCEVDRDCTSGRCEGSRCCSVECASCYQCAASGTSCELAAAGAACDDGDDGTYDDRCDGTGFCQGSDPAEACPADTDCASYQPFGDGTGRCHVIYAEPGTSCDDGLACTSSSTCDGSGGCL